MKYYLPEDYTSFENTGLQSDLLNVKPTLELFKSVINEAEGGLVIGLDAEWGSGKTSFVKMLKHEMKSDAPFIYFDAFKSDFFDDPLTALGGEVYELAEGLKIGGDQAVQELSSWISKAANVSWKSALNFLIRVALKKLMDESDMEEFKDQLANFAGDVSQEALSSKNQSKADKLYLSDYKKQKDCMEGIRKSLKILVVDLLNKFNGDTKKAKNVVFIIDELDRCKPIYAVKLLEAIKHLFLVDKVVFVLAINRKQLSNSISGVYGDKFNADLYLEKFIHLNVGLGDSLSVTGSIEFVPNDFINDLCLKLHIDLNTSQKLLLAEVYCHFSVPARQMSKIIVLIGILKNIDKRYLEHPFIGITTLICIWHVFDKPKLIELINILKKANRKLDTSWLYAAIPGEALKIKGLDTIKLLLDSSEEGYNAVNDQINELFPEQGNSNSTIILKLISTVRCLK